MQKNSLSILFFLLAGMVLQCAGNTISAQSNKSTSALSYATKVSHSARDYQTPINWPETVLPGIALASLKNGQIKLCNQLIEASWAIKDKQLLFIRFTDLKTNQSLDFEGFSGFVFDAALFGRIDAKDFIIIKKPELFNLSVDPNGARVADHIAGKAVRATLFHEKAGVKINWQAELRDGSNYIRQTYSISRPGQAKKDVFTRIVMSRLPVPYVSANSIGTVPGSPYAVPGTNFIAGIEQPGYLAMADPLNGQITELSMPTRLTFEKGDQYQISTMIGYFPVKQRRRTFQYYIEREKASRSRTYLHYNAWYDIAELSEEKLTKVANSYYEELVKKRGVKLDGFVLDDGWDNYNLNLWVPDKTRFPNGFAGLQKLLKSTGGAKLGLWISPCGGYGGQKERLELVKKAGALPTDASTFDLGYPGYYTLFKNLCLNFMKKYGINYFKWDNAAPFENEGRTFSNLNSTSHFMRLCQISAELHKVNPDLFINATVGTWPSPFWLNHVDCTWRMGAADVNWIGKGDNRERGINYRDGEVYRMVVKRAPLYPLNSMMFHGVVLGHCYQAETTSKAGNNMTNEFRSYFALGTNLQELYLSPDMMDAKAWDDLAVCVRWNKKHAKVLIDSHWVSGDPYKSEPYCYASWRANEGVICFRNPDDKLRNITIDIATAFELPDGAARNYVLNASYSDQRIQKLQAKAGIPVTFTLKPFEVLVFDATPELLLSGT